MSQPAPGFEKHPNYQVEITRTDDHIRILLGETVVADTRRPLKVIESKHHPVWYLPAEDVDQTLLNATEHSTYCPFKGHASYWTIGTTDTELPNSVWAYEDPFTECIPLLNHMAFYADKVTLELNDQIQEARGPGWSE